MSNNQTSPDTTPKVFEAFNKTLKYKGEKLDSPENTSTLSWDSNPILKRVASELNIKTEMGGDKGIVLTSGDPFLTFGAKLGKLLGEGESELSFSFLGQLDLGITNAMSDVLEVYNGAGMIQLPEGVTPDKLKATIEQTILKYIKYSVTSGSVNIGVEGIQDYVARYSELLTKASALIILQSPNSQGTYNKLKELMGNRRLGLEEQIDRIKNSGKEPAIIEKEVEDWKFNNSEKVMIWLSTIVFNGSMKRIGEQLEVIRGIVALNSAIDKYKLKVDTENDQRNNKKKETRQEIVKTPSPALTKSEPTETPKPIQSNPPEVKAQPIAEVRRSDYGKEGAPLGERVVRNFIILTGALRIRALPTRGENDNTDNGKDNSRVERFVDMVDELLKREFNKVTLTIVSIAIFPLVATAYGIRSATESQGLKDVFEKLFGPTPEPKPDNEKIDTKDRPEPGVLATRFLSFFERVLPKWKGNPDPKDNKFIVDDGDTGLLDVKYRYLLAAIAVVPLLCFTTATLESLFNRTFRNTSGLNTQMPEFPTSGEPIPTPSPTPIGSVVGNTNTGTFQDPAAGDIGIPERFPEFKGDPIRNPNLNPLFINLKTTTFNSGDTLFATLERSGYNSINDLYNPNSKFYLGGEASVIIKVNFREYSFVKSVLEEIVRNPGENSKRQYEKMNSLIGGYLPDFTSYISNPDQLINSGRNIPGFVAEQFRFKELTTFASYDDFTTLFRRIPTGSILYTPRDSSKFRTGVEQFFKDLNLLKEEKKAPTP